MFLGFSETDLYHDQRKPEAGCARHHQVRPSEHAVAPRSRIKVTRSPAPSPPINRSNRPSRQIESPALHAGLFLLQRADPLPRLANSVTIAGLADARIIRPPLGHPRQKMSRPRPC